MPKRVAGNEKWLQIRLPAETQERLRVWAEKKGVSVSLLVRRLIMEAFEQGRDERGDMP